MEAINRRESDHQGEHLPTVRKARKSPPSVANGTRNDREHKQHDRSRSSENLSKVHAKNSLLSVAMRCALCKRHAEHAASTDLRKHLGKLASAFTRDEKRNFGIAIAATRAPRNFLIDRSQPKLRRQETFGFLPARVVTNDLDRETVASQTLAKLVAVNLRSGAGIELNSFRGPFFVVVFDWHVFCNPFLQWA